MYKPEKKEAKYQEEVVTRKMRPTDPISIKEIPIPLNEIDIQDAMKMEMKSAMYFD
jgi:hypothetical protein